MELINFGAVSSNSDTQRQLWLVTFGDLLTLLLCFFITIVTHSPTSPGRPPPGGDENAQELKAVSKPAEYVASQSGLVTNGAFSGTQIASDNTELGTNGPMADRMLASKLAGSESAVEDLNPRTDDVLSIPESAFAEGLLEKSWQDKLLPLIKSDERIRGDIEVQSCQLGVSSVAQARELENTIRRMEPSARIRQRVFVGGCPISDSETNQGPLAPVAKRVSISLKVER